MTLLLLSLIAAIGCGKNSASPLDTASAPAEGSEHEAATDPGEQPTSPSEPDDDSPSSSTGSDSGTEPSLEDADGDGYAVADDCDDTDPGVYPGAPEICDGRDQDCDGLSDEAATDAGTWYLDADGDGSGDPAISAMSCEPPPGYVAGEEDGSAFDCDDADPGVHPGAIELCDGWDDDCDGAVDEDAADAQTWHIDVDGDGYGAAGAYDKVACAAPEGYVPAAPAAQQDCDDTDALTWPGADELCDGIDNDCDGDLDEDPIDGALYYADDDADGYGDPADVVSACEAPPGRVDGSLGLDCDDADALTWPGADELCDGIDNDCDGDLDEEAVDAPSWYLDEDGDGYGLVGFQQEACEQPAGYAAERGDCDDEDSARSPGLSEVCGDGVDSDCSDETSCRLEGTLEAADGDAALRGDDSGDSFGAALAATASGLLVQAAERNGGVSYLFEGALDIDRDAADADALLSAESPSDSGGAALCSAGDVDGDGYEDLVVGAPTLEVRERGTPALGAGYLLLGPIGGDIDLGDAHARWQGADDGDLAGAAVVGGADLDGDGTDDWLVGAPGSDGRGQVFLIAGDDSGELELESDADAVIYAENSSDGFGRALALAGDVDGDGLEDLLIGATGFDAGFGASEKPDAGAVYLVPGGLYRSQDVGRLWIARFTGASNGALAGSALAAAGDINGDGHTDFLIGAPNHLERGDRTGQAALVLGGLADGTDLSLADAEGLYTGADGDEVGAAVAGVGDLDGDGYDDVAVGAPGVDYGRGTDNGAVYVFYGGRTVNWSSPDLVIYGEDGDQLGAALAGPVDVNGDGLHDLVIGAPGSDLSGADAGAVWIFLGTGQ